MGPSEQLSFRVAGKRSRSAEEKVRDDVPSSHLRQCQWNGHARRTGEDFSLGSRFPLWRLRVRNGAHLQPQAVPTRATFGSTAAIAGEETGELERKDWAAARMARSMVG